MSGEDLIQAAQNGNYDEVVRYVNEEDVEVNSQDGVSFPLKKTSQSSFFYFVCLNRMDSQLS